MGACAEPSKVGQRDQKNAALCVHDKASGAIRCCEGDVDAACDSMCEGVSTGQGQIVHSFPSSVNAGDEKLDFDFLPKHTPFFEDGTEDEVVGYVRTPLSALQQGKVEEAESNTSCVVEWQVVLQKSCSKDDNFGLQCSYATEGSNALVVVRFDEDGPVGMWNKECKAKFKAVGFQGPQPEHMIRVGDRIVSVNSTTGTPNELEASIIAADCEKLKMRLQRFPDAFALILTKGYEGQLCGIRWDLKVNSFSSQPRPHSVAQIVPVCPGKRLLVAEVLRGSLIDHWNQQMIAKDAFHVVVAVGMELTAVGNITGDPELMRQLMREQREVTLAFTRHTT